jgi:Tfp pilus assembly protein PilN
MTVHRKANVWRLLAGGIFVAMIGFSGVYQHLLRREALADLARTAQRYDQAEALIQRETELKRQLQLATNEAELFTYLRHPWPATQVLATALSPLPDCITLEQIHLFQDQPQATVGSASPPTASKKKPSESETVAQRDLRQLREDSDTRPRVLTLSGTTTDTAALQQYLVVLGESKFFVKTELGSMETDTTNRATAMHFTVRLVVRPGYGQPGGPPAPGEERPRSAPYQKVDLLKYKGWMAAQKIEPSARDFALQPSNPLSLATAAPRAPERSGFAPKN